MTAIVKTVISCYFLLPYLDFRGHRRPPVPNKTALDEFCF